MSGRCRPVWRGATALGLGGRVPGRQRDWIRLSETWADPDLGDPDLPFELSARLADYLAVVERLR